MTLFVPAVAYGMPSCHLVSSLRSRGNRWLLRDMRMYSIHYACWMDIHLTWFHKTPCVSLWCGQYTLWHHIIVHTDSVSGIASDKWLKCEVHFKSLTSLQCTLCLTSHFTHLAPRIHPHRAVAIVDGCVCLCDLLMVTTLSIHFNSHFPGESELAGTRISPFWILLELRMMEVLVTTGAIKRAKLVKSSLPTNQHQALYRSDALPVA